jgi:hypothetical protein
VGVSSSKVIIVSKEKREFKQLLCPFGLLCFLLAKIYIRPPRRRAVEFISLENKGDVSHYGFPITLNSGKRRIMETQLFHHCKNNNLQKVL